MGFLAKLWSFMRVRKKFWLVPLIIIMLLYGILALLTRGSPVGPVTYS
jgi:hypothetical protein